VPPKPKRPKVPKTVVTQARELVSDTKRPVPGVQRAKHEKLVKALKKLHPMD
jgi:hypothetical protein